MGTLVVGAGVLAVCILAVRSIYRNKKSGNCCGGCGGNCSTCHGTDSN